MADISFDFSSIQCICGAANSQPESPKGPPGDIRCRWRGEKLQQNQTHEGRPPASSSCGRQMQANTERRAIHICCEKEKRKGKKKKRNAKLIRKMDSYNNGIT